ncbi:RHS repeat-associated core domain-containing protein [Desulfuromonas acetoxidans]|uniref:RHS repeat-associated core domain-containing protein n=1 Tax=Desulfuromonas acetoxidans TaxID=891 RepID=UPI00292D6B3A|nr:RHS repeat-associated core domain-containing protein [Desulfuromonas acetoxidans]
MTYNQSGRLKSLSNSGTVSDYLYDGNNLRVVKDSDGVVTHYHYDLQGRLLAETDSDGTLRRAVVWCGATPAALIDIEQSEPTFYTCTTTESFTDAAGPGMTIDTVAHSIVIQDGDYAGTYAISDEDWQVYPTAIVFSWRGGGVEFQGGLYPDYELPRRSGGLIFYEDDDEGNSQIADIYKVWKESESGGSAVAAPYQVHTDQIGAPVLLTDATGTAVWSAQYAPFGQATINSDVDGDGTDVVCNLRFPGQYFDAESGLHYNWHRYYEPRSGRYITLDPIGLAGGINLYAYVDGVGKPFLNPNLYHYTDNNPINGTDPLGLFTIQIGAGGTIGAGAGGTATSGIVISYDNEKGLQIGGYSNVGGGGHGGANLSGTYEFLYSANDEICDLAGGSTSIGGSVGVARIFSSGAEVNIMHGDAAPSEGIVFGLGPGTKVEEHGYVTSTTIIRIW